MISEYYIETGQKSVMHTLWVFKRLEDGDKVNGAIWQPFIFIKNLSQDKDKAITEAKKFAKENNGVFEGIYQSPMNKRGQSLEIEGVVLKRGHLRYSKDKKPRFSFWGVPSQEFWKAWKERKEELKAKGLSVKGFQNQYGLLDWVVFYNPPNYNPQLNSELNVGELE